MLRDYVVQAPPWRGPSLLDDDRADRIPPRVQARMDRLTQWRQLQALLGAPLYLQTTVLPLVGGGQLGPARDRQGAVLRWGLWAPHREVLIDVFPRVLPGLAEQEDRQTWARTYHLKYAMVRPGMQLTTESLKKWLTEEASA